MTRGGGRGPKRETSWKTRQARINWGHLHQQNSWYGLIISKNRAANPTGNGEKSESNFFFFFQDWNVHKQKGAPSRSEFSCRQTNTSGSARALSNQAALRLLPFLVPAAGTRSTVGGCLTGLLPDGLDSSAWITRVKDSFKLQRTRISHQVTGAFYSLLQRRQ